MKTQLKKGVLEMLVLHLLQEEDRYGYDIVVAISEYLEMSEGTIYPLLNRLKKDELVETYVQESTSGPPRKYYSLTEQGQAIYKERFGEWENFVNSVNSLLEKSALGEGGNHE